MIQNWETKCGEYEAMEKLDIYIHNKGLFEFKQEWLPGIQCILYSARQAETFRMGLLKKKGS